MLGTICHLISTEIETITLTLMFSMDSVCAELLSLLYNIIHYHLFSSDH